MPSKSPEIPVISALIERHGISVFLLIAGGYYLTQAVVDPMVATARQFVNDVRLCNEITQQEIMQADKENFARWDKVYGMMEEKKVLIAKCIDALEKNREGHVKTQEMIKDLVNALAQERALLTKPEFRLERE